MHRLLVGLQVGVLATASACQSQPPTGQQYYDRVIQPILTQSCSRGASGCHTADPADPFSFAAGNLDVTSFANLHKRADVLGTLGVYPAPLLLMKAVGPTSDLLIQYRDQTLPSMIPHSGGAIFTVGSPAFLTLQTWLENGATIDGIRPAAVPVAGSGPCSTDVPADFDDTTITSTSQWAAYSGDLAGVQDVLTRQGCGAQTCHGAPQSDFYITCGTDAHQQAFNFSQLWAFTASPVDSSEFLRRPVAGGSTHTGGAHFTGTADPDYQTLSAFAANLGPQTFGDGDPARTYFADNVMPLLVQRGCAVIGCHSPSAMNDFRLRSGTQGFFSPVALEKNYQLAKTLFLAVEAPDLRRGRMIAKNIFAAHGGIAHRGGPLLEGTQPPCMAGDTAPLCVLDGWFQLERAAIGSPNAGATIPMVYVERDPSHIASLLDVATYQGGSDLLVATAHLDANQAITSVDGARSLLAGCGIDTTMADVHAPDVAGDGDTVVFALRQNAGDTLHLYTVKISGGCPTQLTSDSGTSDFDPAWSPDGAWIVFASTRAGGMSLRLGLPQSDIWRVPFPANGTGAERMTFLSNSEIGPQFIREGRVIMTTEKVDGHDPQNGFYQLSGRRLNWDLTDYHPLLAQRAQSPVDPANPTMTLPSVNYQQATEIREMLDGNFVLIFSNAGANAGAGDLATFNRSVGPFESDRTDPGFLKSVTPYDAGGGSYRSPYPLLDGSILASWSSSAGTATSFDWDIVAVDRVTGARTTLVGGPRADVEAVLALTYPARPFYDNRRQLVFGVGDTEGVDSSDTTHAVVHFPDAPMLATLLGANLRRGRDVAGFRKATDIGFSDASGTLIGTAPLASDGSAHVIVPAATPLYIGLYQSGNPLFVMTEEHQFGPGENISIGVPEAAFDHVCGGCHGSVSGHEIDQAVLPDVLTSASLSVSQDTTPTQVGP